MVQHGATRPQPRGLLAATWRPAPTAACRRANTERDPLAPRGQPGPTSLRSRWALLLLTFVLGSAALGITLNLEPGHAAFVPGTLAMATIWALGARACGPPEWIGPEGWPRQALLGAAAGSVALGMCLLVGAALAGVEALAEPVAALLAHRGPTAVPVLLAITALNGVAEETYFRGSLYKALPARSAWLVSAAIYALATLPAGIALLTAGAAFLGGITGLLRRVSGGLLAPTTAHLIWSVGMLLLLPTVMDT